MKSHLKIFEKAISRHAHIAEWYHRPLPLPLVMILAYLLMMTPVIAKPSPILGNSANACHGATTAAERAHRIPLALLGAISITESGRWDKNRQAQIAWPWTVYAEGRGRYLSSKSAAIKEVRQLRARGVRNIDVGCMQVNLKYHPKAFKNLHAAFDPMKNADYAGKLLKSQHKQHRSWGRAVEFYHSATLKYRLPYRRKVMRIWQLQKRKSYATRAQLVRDNYNARRNAWLVRRRGTTSRFIRFRLKTGGSHRRMFRSSGRSRLIR